MDNQLVKQLMLLRQLKIVESQESFWSFCKTLAPDFYMDSRIHLKTICDTLQGIYEGTIWNEKKGKPYRKLLMSIPPRFGKSRTLVMFCQWVLGKDITNKIITGSYNDDMATEFSRYTRDGIMQEKSVEHDIVYEDIFPGSRIKRGDASYKKWSLEGHFFNYLGVGLGAGVTGKGCNISICDDLVKDAEVALNDDALDKIWSWYANTFSSRAEAGSIEIINMTRWSKKDVIGRILNSEEADDWFVLTMEAKLPDGSMLCEELLDEERYELLKKRQLEAIFMANFHQQPIDLQGRLYKDIRTYSFEDLPKTMNGDLKFDSIIAYVDTADEGNDYLAAIVAGVYQKEAYILDVLFTKDGMEVTEPKTADLLYHNQVKIGFIESNNGGRGFARAVERILWEKHQTRQISIQWFHQSKNKKSRILTNATYVMEHVYFPRNWDSRWKEFYSNITSYQKEGKNKHDDAADALTGVVEKILEGILDVFVAPTVMGESTASKIDW